MKIDNNILDILPLYEYAMAIGQSLDYKESCDLFLKLILRRKNLNAAWILEKKEHQFVSTYAIPIGKNISVAAPNDFLSRIENHCITQIDHAISELIPINHKTGYLSIFKLSNQGYLFLYSKVEKLTQKDLSQLQPVIDKFSVSLKACKAFEKQKTLLKNLELRNQELSDYAHMVSHDLKSPLRSIDALTAWLSEDYKDKLNVEGAKSLGLIRNNVEKMDTLISGILDYSTITKNQTEYYDVDINLLLENILSTLLIPQHVSIKKASKLPVVKGDKYRLQQLFQNLIDNAIKYNDKPEGVIEIGVTDKNEFWEFYVKDNGKGIEETYFKKVFNTFMKLENNPESSGIGLSIVKKIVQLYGGDIWVESEVEMGTTFFFTLKK